MNAEKMTFISFGGWISRNITENQALNLQRRNGGSIIEANNPELEAKTVAEFREMERLLSSN